MARQETHSMGVMCATCRAVLEPDSCACGRSHGYGYQDRNEWAGETWPDHTCATTPAGAA